jgi:hypothetical protein
MGDLYVAAAELADEPDVMVAGHAVRGAPLHHAPDFLADTLFGALASRAPEGAVA